jgi:hypothetical protein
MERAIRPVREPYPVVFSLMNFPSVSFHAHGRPAASRPSAPIRAEHAPACSLKARPRPATVIPPSWEELLGHR